MSTGKFDDLGFIHNFFPGVKKDKVLLLLHGTGGNEDDLLTIGQMLDQRATILAPRGKVLESGMPRYFRRLAEGVFDIEDLKFRTNELASFVQQASAKYKFELGSVIAVGYSNGANVAASVLLMRPGLIERAILFRAMIPFVPDRVPNLSGTGVFLSGGRFDSMIPQNKTRELEELLVRSGANVRMNWEESSHSLTADDVEKAKAWLNSR